MVGGKPGGEKESIRVGRRALLGRGALAAGGAALATLAPAEPASAATPVPPPVDLYNFGAVGDGVADDSGALQAALNALATAGGGELQISPGIYRIAKPVIVNYAGRASTIIIRGRASATQILIATGTAGTAITVQNLASVLIDNLTFIGTPRSAANPSGVPTDAVIALRIDSTLQATLRRCDFYGLSSYVAGGAVVLANDSYLRIEDSAFRGCGASAGIQTSVVTNQNWHGLVIVNTDFIDYGYLYNWSGGSPPGFFSKTAIAAPYAWVALLDAATTSTGAPTNQTAALVNNVTFDEGAKYGLVCLPSASSGRIESLTITGLRVNEAGFGVPNDGLNIQAVDHVLVERSWFGYSPPSSPYSERNMISLRSVPDAVIDACRGDGNADIIVADATVGALTVRETVYRKLLSDAATTKVIQAGLEARLLKADGAIPANSLVVASANPQRVVVAPAGTPASAVLGVALDATASPGDRTRVVRVRGSIVPVQSDGSTAVAPGAAVGPSPASPGTVVAVASGALIGRAVSGAPAGSPATVTIDLLDGLAGPPVAVAATLQGGWTNLAGYAPATFARTAENRVELAGVITGDQTAPGTVILTLPAGYRPAAAELFAVASSGGYASIVVNPDGTVAVRVAAASGYLSLSGVRFAAAQ